MATTIPTNIHDLRDTVDNLTDTDARKFLSHMGYGPDDWHDADLNDGDVLTDARESLATVLGVTLTD